MVSTPLRVTFFRRNSAPQTSNRLRSCYCRVIKRGAFTTRSLAAGRDNFHIIPHFHLPEEFRDAVVRVSL